MKLKFNKDGKFKILLFGDIHETGDFRTNPKFKDMRKLMNAALDEYKPDLCVLLGDNCDDDVLAQSGEEEFRKMLIAVCEPIINRNIPYALILGNHEHDFKLEDKIVEIYRNTYGCITRNEEPGITGAANWKDIIYSSDGETPKFCLWFIDSNNVCCDRALSHYDYVHHDQIRWFERESAKLRELNGGKPMPSFVFQHTPVPEEYQLMRKARFWELPWSAKGYGVHSKHRYVLKKGATGYLGEGPCSPDVNSGQFASWKKVGGVLGAFFGHDHLNDMSGYVDGIFLAQHKTAGFRAYTDGCKSCVRLLTLDESNLSTFEQELRHFKEFGLKSESLGPIFRTLSDRQSINLHILGYSALAIGGAAAAGIAVKKLLDKIGG